MLLLALAQQTNKICVAAAAAGATTIDLTTVYTPISKTSNIAIAAAAGARNAKTKLLQQLPPAPPTPLTKSQLQHQALTANDDINLVVAPSKSYISSPTTTISPKLLKRSGQMAELKQKKPLRELRNRTKEIERSSKLQAEMVS